MIEHDDEVRTVRSFCRICTSVCGILVEVSGDEVLHVQGDKQHPRSRGYTCTKGRALPKMHHHPDRIEHPSMKSDCVQQPTSWDLLLDDLGIRLRDIIDRHGPAAVGIYFGSGLGMDAAGYRAAQSLAASIGTPAKFSPLTIDGCAKVLISDLVGGTPRLSGRPDLDHATFVLLVGSNPMISHGHTVAMTNPKGYLRELVKRAEVWVLDPRSTETARLATGHLAPRPGTDYAVLAFLVRALLADGADREFLARHTADTERLAQAVAPFDLTHVAQLADIAPSALEALCTAVRKAGRIAIETGTGITMSASANVTQWLMWALMGVTGSLNREGGYWFHPGFGYQLEEMELPITPAEGSFGPGPRSRPEVQSFLGEWPCAVLPDEINAGNIRAVLNFGGNLVTAFPDTSKLVPALEKLEVFATIEIIENETTALSTHLLPTKDPLERADVTMWDTLLPRIIGQHTSRVVDVIGDRRSSWWVLAELGQRLGFDLIGMPIEDATDDVLLAQIAARARVPYAELIDKGAVEVPNTLPAPWVDRHVANLGGWRLAPQLLVDQLAALHDPEPLVMVPRRQRRRLNSQLGYLNAPVEVIIHPDDAATANIIDATPVTVRSANGVIIGVAKVDSSIRRGAISVPHGHPSIANVNYLTGKNDIDPITGMAHYSGIAVSIASA